ncbi:uncharacterized protein LOC141909294 [Tubulanus polymorphus]|uniref:uncharacterized protein LOC141909294 n=1 Tax=Tubulanus polymorphus TaxID=672921 RepID=UPI003DA394B9
MKGLLLVVFMGLQVATASRGPPIKDFVTTTLKFGDSQCGCLPKAMIALFEVTYKNLDKAKNPETKLYGRLFTDTYRGRIRADLATVSFKQAKGRYSDYVILDVFADLKAGVLNVEHKGQPGGKCQNLKLPPMPAEYNMTEKQRCFLRELVKKEEHVSTKQRIVSSTFRFNPIPFIDMNFTFTECCKLSSFAIRQGKSVLDNKAGAFYKGEVVSLNIFDLIRRVKPFCTQPQIEIGRLMEHMNIPRINELLDQGKTDGEIITTGFDPSSASRK